MMDKKVSVNFISRSSMGRVIRERPLAYDLKILLI